MSESVVQRQPLDGHGSSQGSSCDIDNAEDISKEAGSQMCDSTKDEQGDGSMKNSSCVEEQSCAFSIPKQNLLTKENHESAWRMARSMCQGLVDVPFTSKEKSLSAVSTARLHTLLDRLV